MIAESPQGKNLINSYIKLNQIYEILQDKNVKKLWTCVVFNKTTLKNL